MTRLLVFLLIGFLVISFVNAFFRMLSGGSRTSGRPGQHQYRQSNRPNDGNVNVDYTPNQKKGKENYKGGQYIDYEEVD